MDSKIETGVPYSFTSIREPFGNNSQSMKNFRKSSCLLGDKRVTVLSVLSPADLCAQLKPTKMIHFNIENM
jgi:hypothetical protein